MKIYITTKDKYLAHKEKEEDLILKVHDAHYLTKKYKDGYLLFDLPPGTPRYSQSVKDDLEGLNTRIYLEIKEELKGEDNGPEKERSRRESGNCTRCSNI